jgi:predicted kinase
MDMKQAVSDADKLYAGLGKLPGPVARPVLVVVSGLPGTGKTYFSIKLSERLPFVVLESDAMRRILVSAPDHSPAESVRLFKAIHLLSEKLLREGLPVIIDATNLTEKHRQYFYDIADRLRLKLVLIKIDAPPSVVKDRIKKRLDNSGDRSEAGWQVYRKMKNSVDKIRRKHYAVDTSTDYSEYSGSYSRRNKKRNKRSCF